MSRHFIMDVAGDTHVGKVRPWNEDHFGIAAGIDLLLIADGVSTRPSGDLAATLAVDTVRRYFETPETTWPTEALEVPEETRIRLLAATLLANRRIIEESNRRPEAEGMATTFAGVLALSDRLWIAHVGDSRVYRFNGGKLSLLTRDHTIGTDLEMCARFKPETLARLPPATLTRALGLNKSVEPDVQMVPLSAGDVVLLATDGLTKVVNEGVIVDVLNEHHHLGAAVATLIDRANGLGGPDNITCILARWTPSTRPAWAP